MSDKLKDHIELFGSNHIFIPTKTLKLTGDVDDDMYDIAVVGLHSLDSMTGPITIKLKSQGGDVDVARAIYDLVRGCKNEVRIQCYGEVASSASIILQAGDIRCMSPNSKIMIHVGSEGIPMDHPRNVEKVFEQHRIDEKWIEDIYLSRIKEKKKRFTRNNLKDIMIWDKFLTPKEALDLGLIDQVGELQ